MLKKSPAGPSVGDDDVFAFNDKFTNKQLKIKINSVQSRESVEEQKETAEKVFADRQCVAPLRPLYYCNTLFRYAVDAAIVRIMKSRKRMEHASLMTELMGQVCRAVAVLPSLSSCSASSLLLSLKPFFLFKTLFSIPPLPPLPPPPSSSPLNS